MTNPKTLRGTLRVPVEIEVLDTRDSPLQGLSRTLPPGFYATLSVPAVGTLLVGRTIVVRGVGETEEAALADLHANLAKIEGTLEVQPAREEGPMR
ncbi:MAG: hypothetical protein KGL39_06850 [Patescibacteria group bacterium]|nr:hypothetical protein [Patescibacteria group bacterium]